MRTVAYTSHHSSTLVKHFVEQAVCMEIRSQSSVMASKASNQVRASDVMGVVETMMGKKRKNNVVVGECLASAEGLFYIQSRHQLLLPQPPITSSSGWQACSQHRAD
ncbi:hypothetical protein LguiA_023686 [Lonicera macranthoides]